MVLENQNIPTNKSRSRSWSVAITLEGAEHRGGYAPGQPIL